MSNDNVIFIKGRRIDQTKLREFLESINYENVDQFETSEGFWKSPITGDLFRTKHQLWGQIGAYLRNIERKDPREPTRAGYVRAIRRGLEPTEEQKRAHREYSRDYRRKRRRKIMEEKGISSPSDQYQRVDPEETESETSIPVMTWD